jgi:hypothetical protein
MKNTSIRAFILFVTFISFMSCERISKQGTIATSTPSIDTTTVVSTSDPINKTSENLKVNLYIENSGSMNGYVNGGTQFKDALRNLLVDIKFHYGEGNIELFFINDQIHKSPIKGDIVEFANKLSPSSIKIGNTDSSNLNEIFRQITKNSDDNTVSLLLSDFIYSIMGKQTTALLGEQKALTRDVFQTSSKDGKNLTTNLYQFVSDFDGPYYDFNNTPIQLKTSRPYYMAVIGNQNSIANFTDKIGPSFRSYNGYRNEYVLTEKDFNINSFSVLTATLNQGKFKPIKHMVVNSQVKGIEYISQNRGGDLFQMALALDLSNFPITEEYIISPGNYVVKNNQFSVIKIGAIKDNSIFFNKGEVLTIAPSDEVYIEAGATHVIVFQSKDKKIDDLEFTLKRNIPNWVYSSSNVDDTDLKNDEAVHETTFGFSYLVEGISEAYLQATGKKDYLNITIPIQKENSSSFMGKTFAVLFIAGFIALIFLIISKNKKRK